MFVRSAFNYDRNEASIASGLFCYEPTRAQQQFKEECDINTIIRNFGLTGEMPDIIRTPLQGDFTTVMDYQEAMNMILESQEAFMTIPAAVRRQFDNDPHQFLEFASDPANLQAMKDMGFGRVERPVEPTLVRVVPEPSPSGSADSKAV